MKKYVFIIIICVCNQFCVSQTHFGVKAGVNIPSTEIDYKNINLKNIEKSPSLGYIGGIFLDMNTQTLGLLMEFLYTDLKSNIEFDYNNNKFSTEYIIKKLDLPILIKYNLFPEFLSINAGPLFKLNLQEDFLNLSDFNTDTIFQNKTNIGYQIGIRVKVVNFAIEIRYEGNLGDETSKILAKEIDSAANINIGDKLLKVKYPNILSFAIAFDF